MTYRVIIEPSAERGLRAAVRWITEHRSPAAAANWSLGFGKKVGTLASQPFRCPLAAENEKFPEEIRELLYGTKKNAHRIIFTVREETVHVLYVHHTAQDELEPI